MTVRELYKLCESEIKLGNGDRHIVISDDEEGNGYHDLFYPFLHDVKMISDIIDDSCNGYCNISEEDPKKLIILG